MSERVHQLSEVFVVLQPDLKVATVPVGPTLYEELDQRFDVFRGHVLIAVHAFDSDWPTWEIHPLGDEVVVLLSGAASLVLKCESGEQTLLLDSPGAYVVVPAGTWHTARICGPTRMLFITPGEGTENREVPPENVSR